MVLSAAPPLAGSSVFWVIRVEGVYAEIHLPGSIVSNPTSKLRDFNLASSESTRVSHTHLWISEAKLPSEASLYFCHVNGNLCVSSMGRSVV